MAVSSIVGDALPAAKQVVKTRAILPAVVVLLAAILAELPALRGGFLTGDDRQLVLNFALVNHPSVSHALELLTLKPHRDLYQPVPLLSFAGEFAVVHLLGLDSSAGGPEAASWLFHLTNLLIHAFNALLVWRLIGRFHEDRRVAFVAALLFAVHPLAAEPTAWLNGRMISLSTLFCLAALNAFDDWLRKPRVPLASLGVAFVVLAMASKVQIGLPVLMILLLAVHRRRPRPSWWILWTACTLITIGFAGLDIYLTSRLNVLAAGAESLQGSRIARTLLALGWYFQRLVCPIGLANFHPTARLVTWSSPGVLLATLTVATVVVVVGISWRWSRIGVMGLVWFLATVAATLPLLPSRNVMVAERYVYLPNIGLFWAIAALAVFAYSRLTVQDDRRRRPLQAIGAVCVLGLTAMSWHVASFYRDDIVNITRMAELYPESPGIWTQLAWELNRLGRYQDAIDAARRDLAKHPTAAASRANQVIGLSQSQLGASAEAIESLQAAVRADPRDGKAYYRLGQVYERAGNTDEAMANYRLALERLPNYVQACTALANLLRKAGRTDEAVKLYERVLSENPYDSAATLALAEIEIAGGHAAAAGSRLQRLLTWMPENWPAWTNLGVCLQAEGRTGEAIAAYQRALAVNPQAATAAVNLAGLLAKTGKTAEANALLKHFTSGNADRAVLWTSHELYVSQGKLAQAAQLWADALKQEPDAPDLKAAYAWTCVLGMQWDAARTQATAALNSRTQPAVAIARMALAMVALAGGDPAPAVAWANAPPDPNQPAYLDLRRCMREALSIYGESHMDEPWPYYVAARLVQADGDAATAAAAMQQFATLCASPACREQAKKLGIVVPPVPQPAPAGQPPAAPAK